MSYQGGKWGLGKTASKILLSHTESLNNSCVIISEEKGHRFLAFASKFVHLADDGVGVLSFSQEAGNGVISTKIVVMQNLSIKSDMIFKFPA